MAKRGWFVTTPEKMVKRATLADAIRLEDELSRTWSYTKILVQRECECGCGKPAGKAR